EPEEEPLEAVPAELSAPPIEPEPEPELAPTLRAPTPVLTAAPTGFVRFRCACGADFQASSAHAGEPARCTRCGDVLFIPARSEVSRADVRPVKASFDQKNRYKPGKDPSASSSGALLALLVLL